MNEDKEVATVELSKAEVNELRDALRFQRTYRKKLFDQAVRNHLPDLDVYEKSRVLVKINLLLTKFGTLSYHPKDIPTTLLEDGDYDDGGNP